MAHFIVEYSSNLDDELDIAALLKVLLEAAIETGVFPIGGLRGRAIRCDQFRVAEGDPENAFVHLTTKMGAGRNRVVRRSAAKKIFETLTTFLQPIYDRRYLSIGFELVELSAEFSFKQNNIHQKFIQQQ